MPQIEMSHIGASKETAKGLIRRRISDLERELSAWKTLENNLPEEPTPADEELYRLFRDAMEMRRR